MEINEVLSICYNFDKHEKNTCVNSSRMYSMFDIPYDFRLSVKFSIHMMNSTRAKIGLSCTNYFMSIVILTFALITTLNKFHLYSLRNIMINLVLVIKYHFDFRLQFDNNKKKSIFRGLTEILLNNGTCNCMT